MGADLCANRRVNITPDIIYDTVMDDEDYRHILPKYHGVYNNDKEEDAVNIQKTTLSNVAE